MIERRRPADQKRRAHSARRKALRRLDYEWVDAERGLGRPRRRLSELAAINSGRPLSKCRKE